MFINTYYSPILIFTLPQFGRFFRKRIYFCHIIISHKDVSICYEMTDFKYMYTDNRHIQYMVYGIVYRY